MLKLATYSIVAVMSTAVALSAIDGIRTDVSHEPFPVADGHIDFQQAAEGALFTSTEVLPSNFYSRQPRGSSADSGSPLATAQVASPFDDSDKTSAIAAAQPHRTFANSSGESVALVAKERNKSFAPSGAGLLPIAVGGASMSSRNTGGTFVAIARSNYSSPSSVRAMAPGGSAPPPPGEPDGPPLPIGDNIVILMVCALAYMLKKRRP